MDQNSSLEELLSTLTPTQIRFVVERAQCKSHKQAAENLELGPSTVYNWPNFCDVKRAVELLQADIATFSLAMRKRALAEAMAVKVSGLRSDDEGVRQRAATELIEWELGKALSKTAFTDPTGMELVPITIVEVVRDVEKDNSQKNG
jgi:hypothetical protein